MTTEQLQFIFSLFSFVGVVGILFYIILERAKREEKDELLERLRDELITLKKSVPSSEKNKEVKEEIVVETVKDKIIAYHEEGVDIALIENVLNIPRAKIEMVLKFHNLNKSDNWKESVDNDL